MTDYGSSAASFDANCSRMIDLLGRTDVADRQIAIRNLEDPSKLPCIKWAIASDATPDLTKELLGEILYRTRWPDSVPVLVDQLNAPNPRLRAIAADALAVIRDPVAGPHLLALLIDQQQPAAVRDTAALALGTVGYAPAWPELVAALNDPAKTVRRCAAKALRFLGQTQVIPALESALEREPIPSVRTEISQALIALQEKRDG